MSDLSITPDPTDEEAAAIAAAVVLVAVVVAPAPDDRADGPAYPRWRFSGRWWNKPIPHGRPRPWRI